MPQKLLNLAHFFVSHLPLNTWAFLGVFATFLGFWAIGRVILGRRTAESALLGWACIYFIALVASVCGFGDLRWLAGLFLALAMGSLFRLFMRRHELLPGIGTLELLLPLLPVVIMTLLMPLMHWDSYWHWVLNGSYLYRFDSFPAVPLGSFPSFHPTYPMATSLVYYFSSLLTGRFVEPAGLFLNVAMSLIALECVLKLLREVVPHDNSFERPGVFYRYGAPVAAFCIVLSLNPSFRVINYYSALIDPTLGVIVLVTVVRWCSYIAGESNEEPAPRALLPRGSARDLMLLLMLGVLIAGMKPSGWVLALVLSTAGVFVGVVHRAPFMRWLAPAAAVLSGSVLAQLLWQAYLSTHLPVEDQFTIQPLSEWRFDLIPQLLKGIVAELKSSAVYYAMLLLTVVAGLVSLVRARFIKNARLSLMLGFLAVALPIHITSVLAAYLGTGFGDVEIVRAASLHRYSTHVGFAACTLGLVTLAWAVLPYARTRFSGLTRKHALALILGLYLIPLGYFVLLPSVRGGSYFLRGFEDLRNTAMRISKTMPADESFVVLGEQWAINFAGYASWNPSAVSHGPSIKGQKIVQSAADLDVARKLLSEWMSDESIDHVWLFNAHLLNVDIGVPDAPNVIWSRASGQWRVVE